MKKYIIKDGEHSASGIHFGITFKKKVQFQGMFDKSCLYDLKSVDNYDINKLCGYSTTWNHHKQSARFGWRCLDKENIQILTYTYKDGERIKENVLDIIKPYEKFGCSIEDKETYYLYRFKRTNGTMVTFKDAKSPDKCLFHYILYPYFGGNIPAPHDMKIHLKRL